VRIEFVLKQNSPCAVPSTSVLLLVSGYRGRMKFTYFLSQRSIVFFTTH